MLRQYFNYRVRGLRPPNNILMINDYIIIKTSPGERDICGAQSRNERGGNDKNEKTVPGGRRT